jgi:hypothetical protein
MDRSCIKHPFEGAEDACRACAQTFCGECLVYAFGPRRPPYCIGCAIAAAGVRSTAANPAASRRERRAAAKERRRERRRGGRTDQVSEALASAIAEEPAPPTRAETAVAPEVDLTWAPVVAQHH